MTMSRLVAPRLDDPASAGVEVVPPAVAAIRCVFGVGAVPEATPDGDGLWPVYRVELPVGAPGSLDADDAHEFDAASLLADLQARARGRAWAMRLELDVVQTAGAAAQVDLYIDAPDDAPLVHLLHAARLAGGGRCLTLATGLVHTPEAVARLAGAYRVAQRRGDGGDAGAAEVRLGTTEYEFE
jgi:hypothetical protein